jgi:very-short-patch-repair endonuclease
LEVLVRLCSVENCPNIYRGRGFCSKHYQKWRRHGDPLHVVDAEKHCSVENCPDRYYGKGFCANHYRKWRRHGDPLHVVDTEKHCSVENCPNRHFGKGFCPIHYQKWRRYGNPLHVVDPEKSRKKQSEAMKGKKNSEAHNRKISESHKGKKLSEEHKKKLSESHKNPSKETRKKMSEAVKKRPKISEATRKKMSAAMIGKKMPKKSEATLKRMSEAQKGKIPSEATRKKISEFHKGKKNSEAHNRKISEAMKGRQFSEEWRKKMSAARRKRITTEETKQKMAKTWSSPKYADIARANLRKGRHNLQKPNKPELKIKKILTDSGLIFNPEQNLNKFIQHSNKSSFGMFINVPFSHAQLEQKLKEVDFLISPNKIVEHNGQYDHADPRKYKPSDKIRNRTAQDIWTKEKRIHDSLKREGYKILVIWEQDLLKDAENTTKKILKFAKT